MSEASKPGLLVLASTYPRWAADPEPGFVHELSKRFVERFRVIVLCPHAAGAATHETLDGVEVIRYRYAPASWETLVNDGGVVANLRLSKWKLLLVPGFVLAQTWRAWRLLHKEKVDIIHAHWLIPQGLIAALLQFLPGRSVPFVVTSHGADLYALRGRFMNALKRFVLRRASAATVVSAAMLDALRTIGADVSKATVQPMGVDLTHRFSPDPSVERSRDELLFVGRLVEKKGLNHLINAMPLILQAHPTAFLTVAGFGPEEAAVRSQVARLGLEKIVQFIGAVGQAELPTLYRRAAIFIAPFVQASSGDQEGLGLVLVEAIGCGCPVVASRIASVSDVFAEGEAVLAVPGDVASLSDAVVASLHLPPIASLVIRDRLLSRFDWETVAKRYVRILDAAVPDM